jgi:hypothetical protein
MNDQTRKGNTMFSKPILHIALCSLFVAAAPAVQAACPAGFATVDLKTGAATISPTLAPFVSYMAGGAPTPVPSTTTCPAAALWKMAAIKIVIPGAAPNACTQANVVVEFEGTPKLWTVNLGDSPTNDGFAGDAGSTEREAELWILDEDLGLAPANLLVPLGIDNPLVGQHLSLTDSALKFVVKNQFVSWGAPYGFVQEPATKNLFSIPDPSVPVADRRAIYLGLNRVIGHTGRTGCGARRVLITFQ